MWPRYHILVLAWINYTTSVQDLTPFWGSMEKNEDYHLLQFLCSLSWCTFFLSMPFSWRKVRSKIIFFSFFKKSQNRRFCFAIFSMKNASTEKTEYTMTKNTEKRRRCSLRFLIFETLSQRFLQNIFRNFQFFEKIKKTRSLRRPATVINYATSVQD